LSETTVNSEAFLKQNEEDIPVDELFFYKYFKEKSNLNKGKTKTTKVKKQEQEGEIPIGDEIKYEDMDSEDDFDEMNFEEAMMQDISEDDSDINDLEEGDQLGSGFAAAEDFADLLEEAGNKGNPKQKAWEERAVKSKPKKAAKNKPRSKRKRS